MVFLAARAISATASWVPLGAGRASQAGVSSISEVGTMFRRIVVRSTPEAPSIMQ